MRMSKWMAIRGGRDRFWVRLGPWEISRYATILPGLQFDPPNGAPDLSQLSTLSAAARESCFPLERDFH
jgi:hypothetical protein